MAIYDASGNRISTSSAKQTIEVLVASSEAPSDVKENADYLCTGSHDELILQQAINFVAYNGGGKIRLSAGSFFIDSFPISDSAEDDTALLLPQDTGSGYSIEIIGAAYPYQLKTVERGTRIAVTESAYEACSSSAKYTILRAGYVDSLMNTPSRVHLTLTDLTMRLPANQKKLMCLNLLYVNRVLVERVGLLGYKVGYNGYESGDIPPVAVEGCIGMRSVGGSNSGVLADFRNMLAAGFYEGFQIGGEHIIGINLSAIWNVYGFTFGNYPWANIWAHNITLINCDDERGVNFPLFGKNGRCTNSGYSDTPVVIGYQSVTLIDFNMERVASETPGGVLGTLATEVSPGMWRGAIDYSIVSNQYSQNSSDVKFWANGCGRGIVTRNQAHLRSGTSSLRRSYEPNFMQQFYDTTVGKVLYCIDPDNKTWVDAQGNTVA